MSRGRLPVCRKGLPKAGTMVRIARPVTGAIAYRYQFDEVLMKRGRRYIVLTVAWHGETWPETYTEHRFRRKFTW